MDILRVAPELQDSSRRFLEWLDSLKTDTVDIESPPISETTSSQNITITDKEE